MPYREGESHLRATHPDIFEKQQRRRERFMRAVVAISVASGAGFFLALFVPAVILDAHEPAWYLVALFVVFFVSLISPLPYANKIRRESVWTVLNACPVCEARIPEPMKAMRSHMASDHPDELRFLRSTMYAFVGSVFGILPAILVSAYQLGLFALIPGDAWSFLAASLWMALGLIWWIAFGRPRPSRLAWETAHLSPRRSRP